MVKRWWYLNIVNARMFWNYVIEEEADGYYYKFENVITRDQETVFAGYKLKALISSKSAFYTIKERLRL